MFRWSNLWLRLKLEGHFYIMHNDGLFNEHVIHVLSNWWGVFISTINRFNNNFSFMKCLDLPYEQTFANFPFLSKQWGVFCSVNQLNTTLLYIRFQSSIHLWFSFSSLDFASVPSKRFHWLCEQVSCRETNNWEKSIAIALFAWLEIVTAKVYFIQYHSQKK